MLSSEIAPFAAAATAAARDACMHGDGATCVSLCRYYMYMCAHCRCNIIVVRIKHSDSFESISQFSSIALVLMGDPNRKQRPRAKTST